MSDTTILHVHAREVLDSRGRPTVEVEISLGGGRTASAIAPSGASTGSAEAVELRDHKDAWYAGLGVRGAVANVNTIIAPALVGQDAARQSEVDALLIELDGSPQKSRLGGNALIAVSLAAAHAGALGRQVPLYQHLHELLQDWTAKNGYRDNLFPQCALPPPMTNMISGGLHAGGNLDFQDVLIMPLGAPDYPTCLEWIVRVYRRLGALLRERGYEGWLVGDEGGYGPHLKTNREAVALVVEAIEKSELEPGREVAIALDVAATHFFRDGQYHLQAEGGRVLSSEQMIARLEQWVDEFPIFSIEDGLAEEDWSGWEKLTARLGDRVQLVGDDLFTTNAARIQTGIRRGAANSVLVKVNQIGTLTETMAAMALGRQANMALVVSARSGETEDSTIADLAVAASAEQIKIGSIVRSERLVKYNRLLKIAESVNVWQPGGAPTSSHSFALDSRTDGVVFSVRARAGGRKNAVGGEIDGALRVSVTQAPEKGKANKAIIGLLSKALGVKKSALTLVAGETSSRKKFQVQGLNSETLQSRLKSLSPDA